MYYVYILKLSNNTVYIGSTPYINTRLKEHNRGKCISTRSHLPVKFIWYCCFGDKIKALRFEKYLKTGSGTAFRHKRLE
ncbi:GIY-YIG nuclease family protein [Patescibacteria group bacterium]|nr:GIY-YIG nuclease family protein [Patescibacteria group bacterium]